MKDVEKCRISLNNIMFKKFQSKYWMRVKWYTNIQTLVAAQLPHQRTKLRHAGLHTPRPPLWRLRGLWEVIERQGAGYEGSLLLEVDDVFEHLDAGGAVCEDGQLCTAGTFSRTQISSPKSLWFTSLSVWWCQDCDNLGVIVIVVLWLYFCKLKESHRSLSFNIWRLI